MKDTMNKNDSIIKEDDKCENKKQKNTYIIGGSILLGSLCLLFIGNAKTGFIDNLTSKDYIKTIENNTLKDYPVKIVNLNQLSKNLTKKESDALSVGDGDEFLLIKQKYLFSKDNGNELHVVGQSIIEFDKDFNKVNNFDFKTLSEDSYVLFNCAFKTSKGFVACFNIGTEDGYKNKLVYISDDWSTCAEIDAHYKNIAYDDKLDEIVFFDISNEGNLSLTRYNADMTNLKFYELKNVVDYNKENFNGSSISSKNGTSLITISNMHDNNYTSDLITLSKDGELMHSNTLKGFISNNAILTESNEIYATLYTDFANLDKLTAEHEIVKIDNGKLTTLSTQNNKHTLRNIVSIDKINDGYIVITKHGYIEETKDDAKFHELLNVSKYKEDGSLLWEHYIGNFDDEGGYSLQGWGNNITSYVKDNKVIIKGFINKSNESDENDLNKVYMQINNNGKIKSLL